MACWFELLCIEQILYFALETEIYLPTFNLLVAGWGSQL